jgi:hypothetical protein
MAEVMIEIEAAAKTHCPILSNNPLTVPGPPIISFIFHSLSLSITKGPFSYSENPSSKTLGFNVTHIKSVTDSLLDYQSG